MNNAHPSDQPPAYSESTSTSEKQFQAKPPPIATHVAHHRANLITSVLDTHIVPALTSIFLAGITRQTYILIPSDSFPAHPSPASISARDIANLPSTLPAAQVTVVPLQGPEHGPVFWLQATVTKQAATSLRARLTVLGYSVEADKNDPDSDSSTSANFPATLPPRPAPSSPGETPSLLRRTLSATKSLPPSPLPPPPPPPDPTASTRHWKLGWRRAGEDEDCSDGRAEQDDYSHYSSRSATATKRRKLGPDQVRVQARTALVSVNHETPLGLLLTDTAPGVWLDVEMGT